MYGNLSYFGLLVPAFLLIEHIYFLHFCIEQLLFTACYYI